MTATFATSPWSLPPGAPRSAPWQFGREVVLSGLQGAPRALQWRLRRNCSITPRQFGAVFLWLCLASLLIGGFFYHQGAPLVLAFTALELVLVGVALLVFARHAADHETLTLAGRSLQVEQCCASRVESTEFLADWLTVEPAAGQGSLVELSGRGQTIRVGRYLRPELRAAFARELRLALRQAHAKTAPEPATN
ncbi:MAG: DUF2244 domain-containing protein [Rubrivivax sp.]|nr:DUF2244 domain-containing protein [Rubrivivax sp.]